MRIDDLLARFQEIAGSPKKQLNEYLGRGEKVVAVSPIYAPEEVIHSMGLVPMGVWGADLEINEAKSYFPAFICSIAQTIVELGIKGKYDGISAIVIASHCDSLKVLGENWKYAVPSIPFIPMIYPQNRANEVGVNFVKSSYKRLIADLEKATGAVFSESALLRSIEIYNLHNQAMRRFSEALSKNSRINAEERSAVFKSAYFIKKEEHTALVEELIKEMEASPTADSSKCKIITSGILADAPALLALFDENKMWIAGDDVAHESRQYRTDAPAAATGLDRLALKFSMMGNCSVLYDPEKTRADLIVSMARETGAQGVVVVLTKFCDPEEFDYPMIKKACEKAGVPLTLIETDRQMVNYEQARTALETFRGIIDRKGAH